MLIKGGGHGGEGVRDHDSNGGVRRGKSKTRQSSDHFQEILSRACTYVCIDWSMDMWLCMKGQRWFVEKPHLNTSTINCETFNRFSEMTLYSNYDNINIILYT